MHDRALPGLSSESLEEFSGYELGPGFRQFFAPKVRGVAQLSAPASEVEKTTTPGTGATEAGCGPQRPRAYHTAPYREGGWGFSSEGVEARRLNWGCSGR